MNIKISELPLASGGISGDEITLIVKNGVTSIVPLSAIDGSTNISLSSVALSGISTAPTASFGNNSQQIANTNFVQTTVTSLSSDVYASLSSKADKTTTINGQSLSGNVVIDVGLSDVGFFERFDDSTRWTTVSTISTNVTTPQIGADKWWLSVAGGSPPSVQSGGLMSVNNGLFYLGSTVPTTNSKMSLGFVFSNETNPTSVSNFNNTQNISFGPNQMINPDGSSIGTAGVVHCNFELGGIQGLGYYQVTNRTCTLVSGSRIITITLGNTTGLIVGMVLAGTGIPLGSTITSITNSTQFIMSSNSTASNSGVGVTFNDPGDGPFLCVNTNSYNGPFKWNTLTNSSLVKNRKYSMLITVNGDYVTYAIQGVGSLTFYQANLHTKIGSQKTYFWWEAGRDNDWSTQTKLYSVWGGGLSKYDSDPAFGGFTGGVVPSLNSSGPHIFPGTICSYSTMPNGSTGGLLGSFTPPPVNYAFQGAATSITSNIANGGNIFIEGGYLSNLNTTSIGGDIPGRCPAVITTNTITTPLSSSAGSETTLKQFVRVQTFSASDNQEIKIFGQLLGSSAKRINIVNTPYGGTVFNSNASGTPLDSISGPYCLTINKFYTTNNGDIVYATMTLPNGTTMIQRSSVSGITSEFAPFSFNTTTVSAGGVTIDGAVQTVNKMTNR